MGVVGGWLHRDNTERFLEFVAQCVGYDFDSSDWLAIETALPGTDSEAEDGWYDYPLIGHPQLTVRIALEIGTDLVNARVVGEIDEVLAARIESAFELL